MSFNKAFQIVLMFIFTTGCSSKDHLEIKKAKVNDIEIAYYIRGDGPPLLMIMGFRGTMGIWDPQLLEILEKHYQLIVFDNRGVGLSTDTDEDHTTIPQMSDDTYHLLKTLGYDRVNVLGWSMGSMIAMHLAVTHPEIIDTLTLCSTSPGKDDVRRTTDAYAKLTTINMDRSKLLALLFPTTEDGVKASEEYVKRLTSAVIKRQVPEDLSISSQTIERQKNGISIWFDKESNPIFDALPSLKVPTLVAGGLDDVLDQVANVQLVARKIPFCWTAYFPGAGHAFLFQDSKALAELVTIFIETNRETKDQ